MADESPALSASQTSSQKRPWVISDSPTRSSDSRPTRPVLESHPPRLGSQALPINVEDTSPRPKKNSRPKISMQCRIGFVSWRRQLFLLQAPPVPPHPMLPAVLVAPLSLCMPTQRAVRHFSSPTSHFGPKSIFGPRPGPIGHNDGWRRSNARGVPESQLLHSGPRPPSLTAKEPHHQCTICRCVKTHPVSYKCGHTHCFICIRVWLQISWKCPDCNQVMHGPPSRNYDLEDWLSSAYPKIAADGSRVTYSWSGLVFPSAPI
ncbi:hypothetical protein B0H14DRAFT_2927033 [Mycena olivaceomarginata]|nr:hypothetical protein B0H14DRAFT_2927033 [Mycena olivaceomarginata]